MNLLPVHASREENGILKIIQVHFPDFEEGCENYYVKEYVKNRIVRIGESGAQFFDCGDYTKYDGYLSLERYCSDTITRSL